MSELIWHPFLYNGIETNIEVTRCGRVKRVNKSWVKYPLKTKCGEIDFGNISHTRKYYTITPLSIDGVYRTVSVHQAIASVFLGYVFNGNKQVIDHIDSDKFNNNAENLRIVSSRDNILKERIDNRDLPTGVSFYRRNGKYKAQMKIAKDKVKTLGYFDTIDEASVAYQSSYAKWVIEQVKQQEDERRNI